MDSHESHILCAVTADGRAQSVAAWARRLSDMGHYRVHYLHATDLPGRAAPAYMGTAPSPIPGYPRELMVSEAEEAARALFDQLGVDVDTSTVHVVHGDPLVELKRKADELQPDFLVLGSRGHGSLTRMVLGSVTAAMADEGRWPLLAVSEAHPRAPKGPVICGVAPASDGAWPVVDVATRFARHLRRPLVLAHIGDDDPAWPPSDTGAFPAAAGGLVAPAGQATPDDDHATILSEIVGTVGGAETHYVRLDGSAVTALADFAEEVDAEAIVVGHRAISGPRGLIHGSVSLDLIREVDRPVMIVPDSPPTRDPS